jgi:hypothetical protein
MKYNELIIKGIKHVLMLFNKYYYGDHVEEDEMDQVIRTNERDEKCVKNCGRKSRREETTWETI